MNSSKNLYIYWTGVQNEFNCCYSKFYLLQVNGAVDVTVLHFIIFQEDIHVVCFIIGMHINEFFY